VLDGFIETEDRDADVVYVDEPHAHLRPSVSHDALRRAIRPMAWVK
jgi:hypothetical protein